MKNLNFAGQITTAKLTRVEYAKFYFKLASSTLINTNFLVHTNPFTLQLKSPGSSTLKET